MPGCADLVSGVSQLAQNATIGIAALCAPTDLAVYQPVATRAPSPRNFTITVPGRANGPEWIGGGRNLRSRTFAPWAAAEFSAIDVGATALSLADQHPTALRAAYTQMAGPQPSIAAISEHVREASRAEAPAGAAGYLFFDDSQSANPDRPIRAALGTQAPAAAGAQPNGDAISGESAADVEGDSRDPTYGAYDVTPDSLLSRGGITVSAGYSSVEGVSLGGKISRQNIGGTDREIAASFRWSQLRQIFEAGYGDGSIAGTGIAFAPKLFAHRTNAKGFGQSLRNTPFSQSAYGLIVQLSRKFDDQLSANASYRLSRDRFEMRGKNAACDVGLLGSVLCDELGRTTNSLFSLTIAYDRRRQDQQVTRGYRLRLAQDIGLGGSAAFSRTRMGGDVHMGLGKRWTLMVDVEGGYLASLGRRAVPLFDRFYAGDTSLRGFDLRGVGPKLLPASAAPGQDVAIGGRAYYVARAELSSVLGGVFERHGLQPSLFVDAGSVFGVHRARLRAGETLSGNSAKPRISAGFGLTMKTPGGTLRLDLARPLARQAGDRTQTFSITFGAAI